MNAEKRLANWREPLQDRFSRYVRSVNQVLNQP
ncbi:MAG: hypothetical protein ACI88G_001497, partial [Woeseiaceae bacterium]